MAAWEGQGGVASMLSRRSRASPAGSPLDSKVRATFVGAVVSFHNRPGYVHRDKGLTMLPNPTRNHMLDLAQTPVHCTSLLIRLTVKMHRT